MSEIVNSIKQCWDQDPDARVSASNIKETFKSLMQMQMLNNASIDRERQLTNSNRTRNDEENAQLIINNRANDAD